MFIEADQKEDLLFRAMGLHLDNKFNEAKNLYTEFLNYEKENALVIYLLAAAEYDLHNRDKAEEYLKKAKILNFNINFADDFSNKEEIFKLLFSSLIKKENPFKAENWEKALNLKPILESVFLNVSGSYLGINDISNAYRVCNEGLKLYPDCQKLKYNKSIALMKSGYLEEGWELNEARINFLPSHKLRFADKEIYDGSQDLTGKTLYVYDVAGFGDTIFFSRYLPLLKEKCEKIIVKTQDSLKELFEKNFSGFEFIDSSINDKNIEFDYQISFRSLANIFKTSLSAIPFPEGFLKADPEKVSEFKKYFDNKKFNVGLFWKATDGPRSLNLTHFLSLADIEEVQLYSFQIGKGAEELKSCPAGFNIIEMGSKLRDFEDTAAAIMNIDLLIACDTAVTNLAGALGQRMWVLLPFNGDWKWELFSEKTAWYKSARNFRQKEAGNWHEVIQRVKSELSREIKQKLPLPLRE